MPANVESMFSVKETPWHGIGHVVNEVATLAEGIKLAGLDWKVLVYSLFREDKKDENVDEFAKVFVRSDSGATLSVVGPNTHPLQNEHAFDFFQPFLDSGDCKLETAGSLGMGKKIWVMVKIQRANSEIVKGDEVAKFVLLSNSHDGTTAVRVGFTPIRVVCANTLAMAHKDEASKLLRVRHTADVKKNVESIRETMNIADASFEATAEQYRFLASRQINAADLRKYVKVVLGMDDDEKKLKTRSLNTLNEIIKAHDDKLKMQQLQNVIADKGIVQEQLQKEYANILDAVLANMEQGRGTENAASRGTFWTAYNALNEHLNYNKGNKPDTRMNSLWFGENAKLNIEALKVATEMADEKAG